MHKIIHTMLYVETLMKTIAMFIISIKTKLSQQYNTSYKLCNCHDTSSNYQFQLPLKMSNTLKQRRGSVLPCSKRGVCPKGYVWRVMSYLLFKHTEIEDAC